jgi:glycosyltransferase involved in cell wall biosynthesis
MKILMIINSLNRGGYERRMLELIKGLKGQPYPYEIYVISMLNIVEYDYVYDLPIKFQIVQRRSSKDFRFVLKLRKIIKDFNPDIIHSWDVTASVYASAAKLFLNKVLINGIISNAYPGLNWFNSRYLRVKLLMPFCKVVVANSNAGLLAYRVSKRKGHCIYNGIDLNRFNNLKDPRRVEEEILGRPKNGLFIAAMVAAFDNRKDYGTLIQAAVKMVASNERIIFLLIGDGPEKTKIMNATPDHFINSRIYFLGRRNDIESILQIADAGLLITYSEGISNSIMEYMASGKPVIATRGGGTNELVVDGQNGFLIEPKRPEQIIEKLQLIMADESLRIQMGKTAYKWVSENFSLSKMTSSYIELYQKFSKNHSSR